MLLAGYTYIYVIWNTAELGVSFNDVAEQRKNIHVMVDSFFH